MRYLSFLQRRARVFLSHRPDAVEINRVTLTITGVDHLSNYSSDAAPVAERVQALEITD